MCEKCDGVGFIFFVGDDGYERAKSCECRDREIMRRKLHKAGLDKIFAHYRLDNFCTDEPWQKRMKDTAEIYLKNEHGWLYVSGQPGCGKTHICTAIAGEFLDKGIKVKYVIWPDAVRRLKDAEYSSVDEIQSMKTAEVLYLDDFLKFTPTQADLKIAFEVLNARASTGLRTIISSERDLNTVKTYDEAIASRIDQMSRGFYMNLKYEEGRDQRNKRDVSF